MTSTQLAFQAHSETSVDAAISILPARLTLRERVYNCIRAIGPVTDEEIADHLGMNPSTERPRRIELQEAGMVRPEGKRTTRSGRQAVAWVAQ